MASNPSSGEQPVFRTLQCVLTWLIIRKSGDAGIEHAAVGQVFPKFEVYVQKCAETVMILWYNFKIAAGGSTLCQFVRSRIRVASKCCLI